MVRPTEDARRATKAIEGVKRVVRVEPLVHVEEVENTKPIHLQLYLGLKASFESAVDYESLKEQSAGPLLDCHLHKH